MFFYTDVFGISAAAFGWMVLLSRNLDAVNDPLMGLISDRTSTKWGKYRPYLLWLCVPFALMGVMMFTTPNYGPTGKLIWAYITFNGFMILYTAINIPYTSMLGVISPDAKVRTSVSSVKFTFAYTAALVVQTGLLPLTRLIGGKPEDPKAWQIAYIIIGVIAVSSFLICFRGTRERVKMTSSENTSILKDFKLLLNNGPWLVLVPLTFTFILFVASRLIVINHYFKYFVGPQEISLPLLGTRTYEFDILSSAFGLVGMAASILGALFVGWYGLLVGKRKAFISLFVVAIISTGAFYFLKPHHILWMYILQILGSFAGAPLSALLWAMYSDTADYGEWKSGRRTTGLVFSASTMCQKFGWAFGIWAASLMLASSGFKADMIATDEVKNTLILFMSLIPAAIGFIPLIIIAFYPLSEAKMVKIASDLENRRKG